MMKFDARLRFERRDAVMIGLIVAGSLVMGALSPWIATLPLPNM